WTAKRRGGLVPDQNQAAVITSLAQSLGRDAPRHPRTEDDKRLAVRLANGPWMDQLTAIVWSESSRKRGYGARRSSGPRRNSIRRSAVLRSRAAPSARPRFRGPLGSRARRGRPRRSLARAVHVVKRARS